METKITHIVEDKSYKDYFLTFIEVNGTRFESIAIFKKEEIMNRFKLTNKEFTKLLK